MNIDTTNASSPSGFYAVNVDVYRATLAESRITYSVDMGGGVTIHHGTRDDGSRIWLMDNPHAHEAGYAIWLEEQDALRH